MVNDTRRSGLTDAQVSTLREEYGPNEIPRLPPRPWWKTFLSQFTSPLIVILVLAAGAAATLGEHTDALVIAAILLLNGALGFVQEWRAERAMAALTAMLDPYATVRRNGQDVRVPALAIVPGDLLLIAAGDRIAADGRILKEVDIEIDESVLTGESVPVAKTPNATISAGTSVTAGRAEVEVTDTGARTQFATIASLTGEIDRRPTQLQIALGRLARWLGIIAITVGVSVAAVGLWAGQDGLDIALTAISLAVALVPEGLPAVVTITLALGASSLVRQNVLVRRMQAVETLGAASLICTDKTGTLTKNEMSATRFWVADQFCEVVDFEASSPKLRPLVQRLSRVASRCTHATRSKVDGKWVEHGSPTEIALVRMSQELGFQADEIVLSENPFSSERKCMSMLVSDERNLLLIAKGAPEVILERSSDIATISGDVAITTKHRQNLIHIYEEMATNGLRVIAFADRAATDQTDIDEQGLCFLGFVGLIDPPRPEVADAVATAKSANIRVIMITGDSPVTAKAIAQNLAIPCSHLLTGADLAKLSDDDLAEILKGDVLFARTKPADKLRIVQAAQKLDAVVAMTGDGVNDAPALKSADIGVAMGQRGTDVAKEAADLILLDDNFKTIISAIKEGRRQFANIKKFVRYLLSSNAGEVVALVVNLVIGGPLIFLATQILWMNLITDGVTAVALGIEKAEPDQMKNPPRRKDTPIIGRPGLLLIAVFGLYTGSASLFLFYNFLPVDPALANTIAFTGMVVFEKLSVFAFRSTSTPVGKLGWFSNRFLILALVVTLGLQVLAVYLPFFQQFLHTVPLTLEHWTWILALSIPLIVVPELVKYSCKWGNTHPASKWLPT